MLFTPHADTDRQKMTNIVTFSCIWQSCWAGLFVVIIAQPPSLWHRPHFTFTPRRDFSVDPTPRYA